MKKLKEKRKNLRKKRVKAKIKFSFERPRLYVFRSSKHIYAQAIDPRGNVIASASSLEIKERIPKKEKAYKVGELIAKRLLEKNIEMVAFDRNGYKYHGRVKALAEGARQGGLKF